MPGIAANDAAMTVDLPPDPAGRHVPRVHGDAAGVRLPGGHTRARRLDERFGAGRDRPVHDLVLRAQPAGGADPQPELPPLAEHARRASGRDQDHGRDDPRAGRQRDRRRPARLLLREPAARPPGAARAPVPDAAAEGRDRRDRVLLDERAPLPVQQARRAPGGQPRVEPAGDAEARGRPGQHLRERDPAELRHRLPAAHVLPVQPGEGEGS